ncbi:UxaA family hydrolase [Ilyobacter polytropus]|jgi:altronate dehydratase small subunit|uniref:SAF domain protein n=1 Tax=Ilyobacter polytropus (strain ATCC 51220 / DSM 2926 / LMG 16218 / CuHBu1) TaxID=572544 RepID=E3H6A3_ILYPC|nr:UxaA family hydrolase [Ilyobacter polytropus]ADO81862.1 SAF domain protein [Ilyobacter polytropus DSM 2926]
MKVKAIVAKGIDNVASVISFIEKNEVVGVNLDGEIKEVFVNHSVPYGHKIALRDIKNGEDVYKYGEVIGRATDDIKYGDYVHVHNVESKRGRGDWKK